jgi:putative endopeptidase
MQFSRVLLLAAVACTAKPKPMAPPAPTGSATPVSDEKPSAGSAAPTTTPTPTSKPAANANAINVTLADVGLEATSLDRGVDPCVDFFQFACGGWLQNTQIPADRARWGRITEIEERNINAEKSILEEAAKGIGVDANAKKIGDYYASCMDDAAIERLGTTPIKLMLDKALGVKDAKTWFAALVELHKLGNWVVWSTRGAADLKDSANNVTILDARGLGLPDRDYYVKPELKDKLDGYRTHVGKMLVIAGMPQAKADAAVTDVLAIETELAKLMKTAIERRDPTAAYNPTDAQGLAKQVKSVDWNAYWKAMGFSPSKRIIIGTPKYFAQIDALRAKFKPAAWSAYFTYHLVQHQAFALPKAFDDEAFELQKLVTGVERQRDRSKRCIESTQIALGELLGQVYAARYFPSSSKQTANTMVEAIVRVMGEQIGKLDWMSDASKQFAQGKLAKVVRMIGYPDKWRIYDFDVKRDDFAGNELRAAAFETHRIAARSGKPVDRSEWQMQTYTVNAYYEPTANYTALPAGILQPPFFGPDRSIAANLGSIGMVIGHELTHGFDDNGAKFDGEGNLKNWWQKEDKDKFDAKAQCVADQYSTFEALPKQFVQGKLTNGENIADLGGVKMAFNAYRALRKDAPKVYLADNFTEDQQFFLAVGQAWCTKDRPAEIQRRLTVDTHSPPKFRVYGALRNLREFAEAFNCQPGTPMRPANTCTVW